MKFRDIIHSYLTEILAFITALVFAVVISFDNLPYGTAFAASTVFITILALISAASGNSKLKRTVSASQKYFSPLNAEDADKFPMPCVMTDAKGNILWYNNLFGATVIDDDTMKSGNIRGIMGGFPVTDLESTGPLDVKSSGREYTLYSNTVHRSKNGTAYLLYFVDETQLRKTAEEYRLSRPAMIHMKIDNLEDIYQNFKGSDSALISGEVENMIEKWASKYPCVLLKTGSGKFFLIAEQRGLNAMTDDKFSILNDLRTYKYKGSKLELTLSIGIGRSEKLSKCDEEALQALSMAQSRGGDQAAVKNGTGFEFFGGVTDSTPKRSKVRCRIISGALSELISSSSNVIITGHSYSDLDSIGAAAGIGAVVSSLNKPFKICVNEKTTLALSLVTHLKATMGNIFISPEEAVRLISPDTLLIIEDTHRPDMLESKELYEKAVSIAVIDHHRKTVDHIKNAVMFYDETSASSTSEMVTELIEYGTGVIELTDSCAEALLAGMMLDTRSFVLRTSSRTFEAAAYLKSKDADMVKVRRLFSNSLDVYTAKNSVIDKTETYKNCAIAIVPDNTPEMRIVASQAADELLGVTGVKASFVLYMTGNVLNISARSLGDVNVQLIMEQLGGGGHLTMAAAQLKNKDVKQGIESLKEIIDKENT